MNQFLVIVFLIAGVLTAIHDSEDIIAFAKAKAISFLCFGISWFFIKRWERENKWTKRK